MFPLHVLGTTLLRLSLILCSTVAYARGLPTPTAIVAAYESTCVSFNNSKVKCFGRDFHDPSRMFGDHLNEMGIRLPYVDFGQETQNLELVDLDIVETDYFGVGVCGLFGSRMIKCVSGGLGLDYFPNVERLASGLGNSTELVEMSWVKVVYAPLPCALLTDKFSVLCMRHRGNFTVTTDTEKIQKVLPRCDLFQSGTVRCEELNGSGDSGQGRRSLTLNPGANQKVADFVGGDRRKSKSLLFSDGRKIEADYWPHSCALLYTGEVKCFGDNVAGQLGQGDALTREINASETLSKIPPIDLGTNLVATEVAVSFSPMHRKEGFGGYYNEPMLRSGHTCVLFSSGGVKCFGLNNFGQLGLGDTRNRGGQPGDMGDSLQFVNLGDNVSAIGLALGRFHTCVLLDNFEVKCFGQNDFGQLGLGDKLPRGVAPGQMGDSLPAVSFFGNETVPTGSPTPYPTSKPTARPTTYPQPPPDLTWLLFPGVMLGVLSLAIFVQFLNSKSRGRCSRCSETRRNCCEINRSPHNLPSETGTRPESLPTMSEDKGEVRVVQT